MSIREQASASGIGVNHDDVRAIVKTLVQANPPQTQKAVEFLSQVRGLHRVKLDERLAGALLEVCMVNLQDVMPVFCCPQSAVGCCCCEGGGVGFHRRIKSHEGY